MKKLFLSLVALAVAVMSYAQSSVLATLSHEGEISTYYGAGALKSAHEAAEHGDVITLSSGSFQATDITKAVTIRGAGMQVDSIAQIYPSVIVGSFNINVPDSLEQHLTVEGIYCDDNTVTVYNTLSNATFIKSRFYRFLAQNTGISGRMKNLAFIHCKIQCHFLNKRSSNSISFVNSVVMNPFVGESTTPDNSFEFTNCVVRWDNQYVYHNGQGQGYASPFFSHYAIYRNCILNYTANGKLPSTNLVYNCLGIAPANMFTSIAALGSSMFYTATNKDVFKTWTGTVSEIETYELTDEAKTKYLGDDGKELGIYGGNLPFTPNPTNPKITKFNVASKSTADGKLSVDIEVKAAE